MRKSAQPQKFSLGLDKRELKYNWTLASLVLGCHGRLELEGRN
jgi:hypothetical protein